MHSLALGFGLGFVVAMQLGPMSLYLVRSTLRSGWRVGLAIGAGIAVIDAVYAAAGAAGAAPLLAVEPLRVTFTLLGAAVLLALGGRTLGGAFRPRAADAGRAAGATPRRAFLTSLAATASNPATIASWAAVFAAASAAGATGTPGGAALLVTGVGIGSLAWMSALTTGTAGARRALGAGVIRAADVIAGAGLLAFGSVLAWHAASG
jgi:putative LysE/RhtB family amino acid efflux pump